MGMDSGVVDGSARWHGCHDDRTKILPRGFDASLATKKYDWIATLIFFAEPSGMIFAQSRSLVDVTPHEYDDP